MPGDLGSSSPAFPLWCSVKGCASDVVLLLSHDMSDPSSSHNGGSHAVLVAASKKFLVGDGIHRILLRFLVWKVDSLLRSLSVILQHSEPYSREEITQLWYSLSLVLVLYWNDFQTLFHSKRISGLTEAVLDVTACPTVMSDSAPKVCKFFGRW